VRQFPNSIWAGIAGFQVNNAFFEASAAARTAPAVKF
jgi:LemA protein